MKCFVCKSEISKESDKFNFCKAINDITVCTVCYFKRKKCHNCEKSISLSDNSIKGKLLYNPVPKRLLRALSL